jgi:hypothetical protein
MYPEDEQIKSTILYYPTIDIPNTKWLRKALLYWDEIGSIIPRNYQGESSIKFSPDVAFLLNEGVFRPIDPYVLITHQEVLAEFEHEFMEVIESDTFQKLIVGKDLKLISRIHEHKVSDFVINGLEEIRLARRKHNSPWLMFENITAHAYMSLLAKYLSRVDSQATVPGTDQNIFQDLIYRSPQQAGAAGIFTNLQNILPMPREDVPFEDILEFRRRREFDLMRFRQKIHVFQSELQPAETSEHVIQIVQKHQQEIQLGLADLMPRFVEDKLAVVFGSLNSILSIQSPTLLGAGLVIANLATNLVEIPIEYEIAGLLVVGGIQIGDYLIKERRRASDELRRSQLSYLIAAHQEGIFET